VGAGWPSVFTGPARLEIRDNILRLELKPECSLLEIGMLESLRNRSVSLSSDSTNDYTVELSSERDWITVSPVEDNSLRNTPIEVILVNLGDTSFPTKRYITEIKIDKQEKNIPYFYYHLIDHSDSNVKLYYAFQIYNISSYAAEIFGQTFIWGILSTLIILLLCQILLFVVWIILRPEPEGYIDKEGSPPITFIDELSDRFAVPLGFLGTVVSIWYSLEDTGMAGLSYVRIVDIMKFAIFSTVMGLSIKVLFLIRGYRREVRQRRKA
jgi:hypothetical protein